MKTRSLSPVRPILWPSSILLVGAAVVLLANAVPLVTDYGHFSLLGLLGAIVANSTGAGGGVVFIPAFAKLGLTPEQAVASSFGIQCFGMTAGALAWHRFSRRDGGSAERGIWRPLKPVLGFTLLGTLPGILLGRALPPPAELHTLFSHFSMTLGAVILLLSFRTVTSEPRQHLGRGWYGALVLLGIVGGVITAWLSVGVGELLVILLILLGCHSALAVAAGVMVSAATVWFATGLNLIQGAPIIWQIVLFAGPAAVVGGVLARRLATLMSPVQLKRFFACWILFVGLIG
ncbi:sulfite exporter TauE/SafE family protein [Ferrimonas balearica]|uniref:sulfite exporter TauE/SafE family protein n=1 Tax=Ferrimonas balearica TaxID=44012 RepID=UPI001C996BAA|nr:sulfite exporter TauE/SafE family protein [Ferrimonas balearica]MBY5921825.1 sulfite exporter TauE/SafE family protein [Ferrimonas balearica]MBY5994835.1 sulfite exporter TauE/SafE family protein [Ferrimonas balearica]